MQLKYEVPLVDLGYAFNWVGSLFDALERLFRFRTRSSTALPDVLGSSERVSTLSSCAGPAPWYRVPLLCFARFAGSVRTTSIQ